MMSKTDTRICLCTISVAHLAESHEITCSVKYGRESEARHSFKSTSTRACLSGPQHTIKPLNGHQIPITEYILKMKEM